MADRLAQEAQVLCKDTHGRTLRIFPRLVTPEAVLLDALDRLREVVRGHPRG
jgi:acetylornithine/succinyldiaminopimelate/putrescine aminotransferase